ncbi:MAG: hypothetical protein WA728_17425, partial [Xanthobacteraceae bacterium]
RRGLVTNPAPTPWAHEFTGPYGGACSNQMDQMHQMPFETIDAGDNEDIDARRPEGASNVPKGCGDLMKQDFDAAAGSIAAAVKEFTRSASPVSDEVPTNKDADPAGAADRTSISQRPLIVRSSPVQASEGLAQPGSNRFLPTGDDLDIPSFLRREQEKQARGRPEPATGTAPLHQRPANTSTSGGARVSTAAPIDINIGPKR